MVLCILTLIQITIANDVSSIINNSYLRVASSTKDEPTFVMVDKSGKVVKDIVLYMDTNTDKYYCQVSEFVQKYTVDPPLPSRFSIDRDGILVSNPSELLEKTQYTIWAKLLSSVVSYNITITVIACPYDMVYKFDVRSEADVIYSAGDQIIYQGHVRHEFLSFCLPYKEYNYTITCTHGAWSTDE